MFFVCFCMFFARGGLEMSPQARLAVHKDFTRILKNIQEETQNKSFFWICKRLHNG